MIGTLLSRLLLRRPAPPRPSTRLDDAEAVALAAAIIARPGIAVLGVAREGPAIVWTVGTRNRGANQWVRLDDATGAILEHRRGGLR